MNGMIVFWVGSMIAAVRAQECKLSFARNLIESPTDAFLTRIKCSLEGLRIYWEFSSGSDKDIFANINVVCVDDVSGEQITEMFPVDTLAGPKNDTLIVSSTELGNISTNGGTCTVYGCHQDRLDLFNYSLNQNDTCAYLQSINETISNNTDALLRTHLASGTTDHTRLPTVSSLVTESEILSASNSTEALLRTHPASSGTNTDQTRLLTTSKMSSLVTSREVLTEPPPVMVKTSTKAENLALFIALALFVFAVLVTSVLCGGFIKCVKLRREKYRRHQQYPLDSLEKIDPHFTPICIMPDIKKYESMQSIFDSITQTDRDIHENELSSHLKSKYDQHVATLSNPLFNTQTSQPSSEFSLGYTQQAVSGDEEDQSSTVLVTGHQTPDSDRETVVLTFPAFITDSSGSSISNSSISFTWSNHDESLKEEDLTECNLTINPKHFSPFHSSTQQLQICTLPHVYS